MLTEKIVVMNPSGLHARPASQFVKITGGFKSDVKFVKETQTYNGKSILSVLSACVKYQDEIEFQISGEDEAEAMEAIISGIRNGLGEEIEH